MGINSMMSNDNRPRAHARSTGVVPTVDPYRGKATVHWSPAYDLLVSLRALYNPRTFVGWRSWSRVAQSVLPPGLLARGTFFFQGFDTALGYGTARLISALPAGASPARFIAAVRRTPAPALALLMLDTGETDEETLAVFREHLEHGVGARRLSRALDAMPAEWAQRCRRVLQDPDGVKADYLEFLRGYVQQVFRMELPAVERASERGTQLARDILAALPTDEAIERLTGGYTIAEDLQLRRIVLAPSLFLRPFMLARVDERVGEALVVFGVPDPLTSMARPDLDPGFLRALKVLGDPARLRVLRLLGVRARLGSELVSELHLSQPTVHHHLAQLRIVGLIRQERGKGGMRYTLRREAYRALLASFEQVIGESSQRSEGLGAEGKK